MCQTGTGENVAGGIRNYLAENGDKLAVSDEAASLTWDDLNCRINQVQRLLFDQGIEPGGRVAIMSTNCTDFAVISVAAHLGGLSCRTT